ncbi:MAG: sigma-70 family RNA polymerase sigma factor [Rickettsiales bacterium]|nr:sigma-70 family RNA polymerase sigma factor [Rickettsiales bacterium]
MPDESLMDFIHAGEVRAFETLVSRHHQRFYRQVYRWVLHAEDAEDVVQEAFMKIWSGKARWKAKKKARFTTWFYRILYNQAVDLLRKRNRSVSELKDDIPDEGPTAEDEQIDKQRQMALRSVLKELPERQRIAVNLFYFEDLSQKQIADMMGISVKALESLLSRARTQLRSQVVTERMERYG